MTTQKQRDAVHFCEEWLHISFDGDLNDFWAVNDFLETYLDQAKDISEEITCEYETWIMEKLFS